MTTLQSKLYDALHECLIEAHEGDLKALDAALAELRARPNTYRNMRERRITGAMLEAMEDAISFSREMARDQ